MARDQSALTELLDALKSGGDLDFMRRAMEVVLQLLIELEATEKIGAGRYERTETRTAHRNGTRSRLLSTKAGDVNLQIPKLRQGSFFPSLLEPRRRIDKALSARSVAGGEGASESERAGSAAVVELSPRHLGQDEDLAARRDRLESGIAIDLAVERNRNALVQEGFQLRVLGAEAVQHLIEIGRLDLEHSIAPRRRLQRA